MPGPHDGWQATWRIGADAVADESLWTAWEDLRARVARAHVFHRPAVLRAWYDTVAVSAGLEPAVGQLTAPSGACVRLATVIAPHHGRFIARAICEPAGQDLFGYHDPLTASALTPADWDVFWQTVRESLRERADVGLFRFVHDDFAGRVFREPAGDESPILALDDVDSLEALLARCSPNHRGDVRRRMRRLAEKGEIDLHVFDRSESAAAAAEFAEHFWPAWEHRHKGERASERPGLRQLCARVASEGVRDGWGHSAVLRVGGIPVAWHLGLSDERRVYWWMPVHAEDWDALSPGKVFLALLLERLVTTGWRELHFQTGAQPYKLAWRPLRPPLATIRWHAPSLKGRVLAGYDQVAGAR